jgi:hypothetical protein
MVAASDTRSGRQRVSSEQQELNESYDASTAFAPALHLQETAGNLQLESFR